MKYLANNSLKFFISSCLIILLFTTCNQVKQNKAMKIYHLKPNRITINDKSNENDNWFKKERTDFFTIENFDITSGQHKTKVDSFVLDYYKKENFLETNNKASWSLVFFKYGDGISESTPHKYDTDYHIHELFAFQKRLIYYYFTSENGYENTGFYLNNGETIQEEKRILLQGLIKH